MNAPMGGIGESFRQVARVKGQRLKNFASPVTARVKGFAGGVAKTAGKVGRVGGALSIVGAGADYAARRSEGQSQLQAIAGAGAGAVGGTVGAIAGGTLGSVVPGPGTIAGGVAGGVGGGMAAAAFTDWMTGANQPQPAAKAGNTAVPAYPTLGAAKAGNTAVPAYPTLGAAKPPAPAAAAPAKSGGGVDPMLVGLGGLAAGAAGLGVAALTRGRVKPQQVAQVAQAATAAAPKVAAPVAQAAAKGGGKGLGGNWKETAKYLTAAGVGSVVVGEFIKATVANPILRAAGLYAPVVPAAPPPVGMPGMPRGMGRYDLPSQPAWWDSAFFGGQLNERFGNPGGLEYQRMQKTADIARERMASDERMNFASGMVQLQSADLQSGRRLQGVDLQSGRQLQGQKYTADRRLQGVDLQSGRQLQGQKYTADQRLRGVDLESGRKLQGQKYTADRRLQGVDLQSGRQLQGQKYTADRRLQGQMYAADRRLQGVDLQSGRQLQGQKYTADARITQEGVKQSGQVAIADRRLYGQKYVADARITQEGVKQSGQVAVAGQRARGQISSAALAADSKVRVAAVGKGLDSGYTTGTGVQSGAGLWSGGSVSAANLGGHNNVRAVDFGNDRVREQANASARKINEESSRRAGQRAVALAGAEERAHEARMKRLFGG